MTYPLLPDPEGAFIAWARVHAALTPIVSTRVGTRLSASLPAIRVQRIGGAPPWPWEDRPELQVECWAGTEIVAEQLARTVIAALPDIRAPLPGGGRIASYEITSGPFSSPDDPAISNNSRYLLTVELITTP